MGCSIRLGVYLHANHETRKWSKGVRNTVLTQQEADALLEMLKKLKQEEQAFIFPSPGEYKKLDLISEDGKYAFVVDVNRKGYINIARRYTYQGRYQNAHILLRLDINGPEHRNPDGTVLSGNHMHIYREGLEDKFAVEIPNDIANPDDLCQTLIDFLVYFKTTNAEALHMQTVIT